MKKSISVSKILVLILLNSIAYSGVFKYYGAFKNIDVLNDYCNEVGCSVIAPNDFHNGEITLSIMDTSTENFYQSLKSAYDVNGWKLQKKRNKIYVAGDTIQMKTFLDYSGMVRTVPLTEYYSWKKKDSIEYKRIQDTKDSLKRITDRNDSLKKIDHVQIIYAIVSNSYLQNLGTSWGKPLLQGNPEPSYMLNWMLHLDETKDTLYDYRNVTIDMDTAAQISWGQIVTETIINESDKQLVTTKQDKKYGFTIQINEKNDSNLVLNWDYFAPPPSDYSTGTVTGRGLVCASGGIDIYGKTTTGIPVISRIPVLGWLFRFESEKRIKSKLFICARYSQPDLMRSIISDSISQNSRAIVTGSNSELPSLERISK